MTEKAEAGSIDLGHFLAIILRRRWVAAAVFVAIFVLSALYTFTMRPVYKASALLVIEKERGGLSQSGTSVENSNDDYYQTQYKLLQSRTLLRQAYEDLALGRTDEFSEPEGVVKLSKAITVTPVLRSRLVYVNASARDADLAAQIANRLSELFVERNLANQLFISKEVLLALQSKASEKEFDNLPAVVNNPLIQSMKGDYAKLQSRLAELSERYTDKHPAVQQNRSSMIALENQIRFERDRIVASLKTELSGQLRGNNVRIVDPAITPKKPERPRIVVYLVLGAIAGILLGLSLAFAVDAIDQTIRSQEDVEGWLDQPFLGTLPQTKIDGRKVFETLLTPELSLTSEALRNLRTMVDFAGVDGHAKAMIVTSSVQGEGKSYVAANLAVAFSQLGQSVLLIDGDLRRPNIHRLFALSTERGICDFLAKGTNPDEIPSLVRESGIPHLRIMPCGPRPPNPSELLNTPRLAAILTWASANFDRVLIDCTPMFPINDTLLWGRHIASHLFVVRHGETRVPAIRAALRRIENGHPKVLGVVLNAAQVGGFAYAPYQTYYQQYYQPVVNGKEKHAEKSRVRQA